MDIDFVFRIAGIGIIVTVISSKISDGDAWTWIGMNDDLSVIILAILWRDVQRITPLSSLG